MPPDSGSTGSYIRLVPSSGNQNGVIAFDRTAAGAFNSVLATFDFRITPPSGATPADGMGFALLSATTFGSTGAGPFFAEEPSLASSIGVGFDVYGNASTPQEPNGNHVSVHWNGAQVGNAYIPSFTMANGMFHRAQVIVWFSGSSAYVTVRLTPNINGTPGPTETVVRNALISGAAAYQSRVAFGARTGGAWASHDLDNVNVQDAQNLAAAAGLSLLFLPVSQFGPNGPGATLGSFADWPLVANTLALDLAFNPSNLFNDASLCWNGALNRGTTFVPGTLELEAGVFHHINLELDSAAGGAYVSATIIPDAFGLPGRPVNVFSNQFISGLAPGNCRLEFAGRNGGLPVKLDLDNVRAIYQSLTPLLLNPGESIVVGHNLDAFASRYGTGPRVAGEYSGSLANTGERLTLTGPLGEPILDFSYDPSWFPITAGSGFSLVAVDPTNTPPSAWGVASSWRASSELGGSPGTSDPAGPAAILSAKVAANGKDVSLTWPATSGSFELYSAATLDAPGEWTRVTNAPTLLGGQWVVTPILPTNGTCFYRLQSQSAGGH